MMTCQRTTHSMRTPLTSSPQVSRAGGAPVLLELIAPVNSAPCTSGVCGSRYAGDRARLVRRDLPSLRRRRDAQALAFGRRAASTFAVQLRVVVVVGGEA